MRKSNHQKHGFRCTSKAFRRDKSWTTWKGYTRKAKRRATFNGNPVGSLFATGEVGIVESIRFIETGGQF